MDSNVKWATVNCDGITIGLVRFIRITTGSLRIICGLLTVISGIIILHWITRVLLKLHWFF